MTDMIERGRARGVFRAVFRDSKGKVIAAYKFPNAVATVGANLILSTAFAGSGYSVTGPYMGIISSVSFTGVAGTDTMALHPGWLEADSSNAPPYTVSSLVVRATAVFGAAANRAISLSTGLIFNFTGPGTAQGAFMLFGPGAVNTQGSGAGTLVSAGTFPSPQPVLNGNTLTVSYTFAI